MITISTENRLKEIADNLKQDVKELLDESANIVTEYFKDGFFTANGVVNSWKSFTRGISNFAKALSDPDLFAPVVLQNHQPLVTVEESGYEELPTGTRLPLSEVEQLIEQLNYQWDFDEPDKTVRVVIDYRMDNQHDRYRLPVQIGRGHGTLLEQMQHLVESSLKSPDSVAQDFYNASPDLGKLLHEHFGPHIQENLEKLSTRVLNYFQQHCTISRLEQQFEKQAQALPAKDQKRFRETMKTSITALRIAANTGQDQSAPQRKAPIQAESPASAHPPEMDTSQRPHPSVRVQLRQIKEGQSSKPVLRKSRNDPQR